jgi:pimeloyl-ACP methyl ester carboxylesterase
MNGTNLSNGEQTVSVGDVELCIETFGRRDDPTVLLIHGACASMLWWETALCERIAAHGRRVVRYDNRDTGRSTSYPAGHPGYSLRNMVGDAVGILDHLQTPQAHVVGRSMAGAIALALGVEHRERIATLTFVTSTPGDDDLPPMSQAFLEATSRQPDFASPRSVEDHIVNVMRAYSGASPYFDEQAMRALARQDVARSRDMAAALSNHFAIEFDAPSQGGLGDLRVPCLVVHGELDPVYPLPHGVALQRAIPGAELLVLDKAGHELPQALWDTFLARLIDHTRAGRL